MELRTGDVAALHDGGEALAVLTAAQTVVVDRRRIAVDEIGVAALGDAVDQRAVALPLQGIPTHVRHTDARRPGQLAYAPCKQAQARRVFFFGMREQQLHADAHAQQRLVQRAQRVHQAEPVQSRHAHRRRTYARQDHPVSAADRIGIAGQLGLHAQALQRVAHRSDVGAAGIGLRLHCAGDLHIDEHHTVEDCGLALGEALRAALGDKRGLGRYGDDGLRGALTLPMDEALAGAAVDLSGRPYFVFSGEFPRAEVGGLATELVPHFFRSLCDAAGLNLNLKVEGDNDHHKVEASFKALARALRQAVKREGAELPSTKGAL